MKKLITVLFVAWLLKHCIIIPIVDWEQHDISGIEIRIKFEL